jgi:hypothetical protein
MIVFDLQCSLGGHIFEAWFSSSNAYEDQKSRALIACPVCNDTEITKAIMAPNIPAKGNQVPAQSPSDGKTALMTESPNLAINAEVKSFIAKVAQMQADTIKQSKWVGKDFERQARAMASGEIDHSIIHGQATPDQAQEMIEDGIGVMPLLVPVVPPEECN